VCRTNPDQQTAAPAVLAQRLVESAERDRLEYALEFETSEPIPAQEVEGLAAESATLLAQLLDGFYLQDLSPATAPTMNPEIF